jgi:hypothetical protein
MRFERGTVSIALLIVLSGVFVIVFGLAYKTQQLWVQSRVPRALFAIESLRFDSCHPYFIELNACVFDWQSLNTEMQWRNEWANWFENSVPLWMMYARPVLMISKSHDLADPFVFAQMILSVSIDQVGTTSKFKGLNEWLRTDGAIAVREFITQWLCAMNQKGISYEVALQLIENHFVSSDLQLLQGAGSIDQFEKMILVFKAERIRLVQITQSIMKNSCNCDLRSIYEEVHVHSTIE